MTEVTRVIGYPHLARYGVSIGYASRFLLDNTIPFKLSSPIKRYIPADPDDDYVVALALQTNSGFITSGDSHILQEKVNLERRFKRLNILSKGEFEQMFV